MIHLRAIDGSNRAELEALELGPGQDRFVSNVRDSLLEAEEEPDGRAIAWGVYSGEVPVGFVMISDEVGAPEYFPHFLWKLLIDVRYQRCGYGSETLALIIEYFRNRPGVDAISTSAGRGEGSPIPFYERHGFVQTGDIVFDDEMLMRLQIR